MFKKGIKIKYFSVMLGTVVAVAFAICGMLTSTCSYADSNDDSIVIRNISASDDSSMKESEKSESGSSASKGKSDRIKMSSKSNNVSIRLMDDDISINDYQLAGHLIKYNSKLYPDTYRLIFDYNQIIPGSAEVTIDLGSFKQDQISDHYYIFTMDDQDNFTYYCETDMSEDGTISFKASALQDYYISYIDLESAQKLLSSIK